MYPFFTAAPKGGPVTDQSMSGQPPGKDWGNIVISSSRFSSRLGDKKGFETVFSPFGKQPV
jgi:hypothetical protein